MFSHSKFFAFALLFILIISLSAGSVGANLLENSIKSKIAPTLEPELPKYRVEYNVSESPQRALGPQCNFDQPECQSGNCFCNVNENELLDYTITFTWDPPSETPMCVKPVNLPVGATAPSQVSGIGGVTVPFSWTPTYCQSGCVEIDGVPHCQFEDKYIVFYDIGFTCGNTFGFIDVETFVNNVNRLPVIETVPSSPVSTLLGSDFHMDVTANDPDALECTDPQNKDVLTMSKVAGLGVFVDNANGDADFDWIANFFGLTGVIFNVNDGRGGDVNSFVDINVVVGAPEPLLSEADPIEKNRYVSFLPQNTGKQTAIRVTISSLMHPDPEPTGTRDFSRIEGQVRWADPPKNVSENSSFNDDTPPTFVAAKTSCQPHFADWGALGEVSIFGEEIIPSSVYDIQVIYEGCDIENEECYSAPLQVKTSRWGDVVGINDGTGWLPPDNSNDIGDILSIISKFSNTQSAPVKARTDLEPQIPDQKINVSDALKAINAFQGLAYPFDITTSC